MLELGRSIEGKKPDREAALESLREHRQAIEYGLFRPESVNLPPIHEQSVVDTCHVGWIPLAFKRGVMKWITQVKDNTTLTGEGLAHYRQGVLDRYGQVQSTVNQRALLLRVVTGQINTNYVKGLRRIYCEHEESTDDEDCSSSSLCAETEEEWTSTDEVGEEMGEDRG